MIPWAHPSPQPKWHLDRFSYFAGLTTVTDHATRAARIGRMYVHSTAMWPNNNRYKKHNDKLSAPHLHNDLQSVT